MASLMSLGARAMTASYAVLQTTGHNIANAGTAGYSRQQVGLQTSAALSTGSGYFGQGVDVKTVTRANDRFLTREAATTQSLAAADATRLDRLQQLEKVFATGEDGLGHAADQLMNAFVDVASRPQDAASRQVVLARAEDAAARFRDAGERIDGLQTDVTQALKVAVGQLGALAQGVAHANMQIVATRGAGQPPNDLLDERDRLVGEIGKLVQVSTVAADDGSLSVFIGGGQRLVIGGEAATVGVVADSFDPAQAGIAVRESGADRTLPPSMLVGGSIAGLVRFQSQDLKAARDGVGRLAAALGGAVNLQQSLGLDLKGAGGAPIFAVGAPRVLPASTNARAADGSPAASSVVGGIRVASVATSVVDAAQLLATDYELRADPADAAGTYRLTRLSDGVTRSVSAGSVVDGIRIDISAPAPAAGDRFLLQPVAAAASGMRRVLDDATGIAAALPVAASFGAANTGTAMVGALAATGPVDRALTATIAFTSANGDYAWQLRDAASAVVSSGTATWNAATPIALNGWSLDLAGVPKSGDTLTVGATAYPQRNNGNALAQAALRDRPLVAGETVGDAWAGTLADIGVRVQNGRTASTLSAAVAGDAEARRAGLAGVNLDEEAARLMQYQQSYQAAAKVLQVAQSVMDTLLQTVRG